MSYYFTRNTSYPSKVWVHEEILERAWPTNELKVVSLTIETLSLFDAVQKYGYCQVR